MKLRDEKNGNKGSFYMQSMCQYLIKGEDDLIMNFIYRACKG